MRDWKCLQLLSFPDDKFFGRKYPWEVNWITICKCNYFKIFIESACFLEWKDKRYKQFSEILRNSWSLPTELCRSFFLFTIQISKSNTDSEKLSWYSANCATSDSFVIVNKDNVKTANAKTMEINVFKDCWFSDWSRLKHLVKAMQISFWCINRL